MAEVDGSQDKALIPEKKKKLEEFFHHIITNAPVDITNREIQDIQNAVFTMLEKIRTKVNSRGIFNIDRIVPGGSMNEKTAIWKFYMGDNYLEFDFLAVLKNAVKQSENQISRQFCQGCITIPKPPVELERLGQHYNRDEFSAESLKNKDVISNLFLIEINHCLTSSCDCLSLQCDKDDIGHYKISLRPSSVEHNHGCGECTVGMPTGTLHANTKIDINYDSKIDNPCKCSLIFQWTSKTKTLSAPDMLMLKRSQLLIVPIYVDFLPALEFLKPTSSLPRYEHDFFIVPKSCTVCPYIYNSTWRWRNSWCMAEICAIITELSDKHKRCYQIMKYLSEIFYKLPSYSTKTVVLRHHTTCSDTTDDCVDCVMRMYRDLLQGYETKVLLSYKSNLNINGKSDVSHIYMRNKCELLINKLCSVSVTESWETFI